MSPLIGPEGLGPEDFTVHFAVVPVDGGVASVQGHDEPRELFTVDTLGRPLDLSVDGSWACWGSDDRDCDDDHDDTLHVVLNPRSDRPLLHQVGQAWEVLRDNIGAGCRLLDYAVVSSSVGWSEQVAVYTADLRSYPRVDPWNVTASWVY